MSEFLRDLWRTLWHAIPPYEAEHVSESARKRHYRWRKSMFLLVVLLGILAVWGWVRYARAADIAPQIERAVAPVRQEVTGIKNAVDDLTRASKAREDAERRARIRTLRSQIVETRVRQCREKEPLRSILRKQVEDALAELEEAGVSGFQPPSCTEL